MVEEFRWVRGMTHLSEQPRFNVKKGLTEFEGQLCNAMKG